MTDNTKKTSDLTVANTVLATDRLILVANTVGVPATKSVNVENLYKEIPIQTPYLILNDNLPTPNSSSANVSSGSMWFDSNYLYIAVSNNSIKRITLETF